MVIGDVPRRVVPHRELVVTGVNDRQLRPAPERLEALVDLVEPERRPRTAMKHRTVDRASPRPASTPRSHPPRTSDRLRIPHRARPSQHDDVNRPFTRESANRSVNDGCRSAWSVASSNRIGSRGVRISIEASQADATPSAIAMAIAVATHADSTPPSTPATTAVNATAATRRPQPRSSAGSPTSARREWIAAPTSPPAPHDSAPPEGTAPATAVPTPPQPRGSQQRQPEHPANPRPPPDSQQRPDPHRTPRSSGAGRHNHFNPLPLHPNATIHPEPLPRDPKQPRP